MRRRAWVAWGLVALGLTLAVAGRSLPGERVWSSIAGLCLLAAIVLGLSMLPYWTRLMSPVQPLPDLFQKPTTSERWCGHCGNPTPRKGPCRACGHTPATRSKASRASGR